MFNFFRSLVDRPKALFAVTAAQEFEAEFLARNAAHKAELLRLADQYAAEGLPTVAQELRHQAENLNIHKPLAVILPAMMHFQVDQRDEAALPLKPAIPPSASNPTQPQIPGPKKKGGGRDQPSA
jgi:hypothetical protein